jgi:formylglycine-generating enzyme required for sulfatase activity/tRNA A-37 threonylcarbamoyl transferase component Bud32
MGEYEILQLLGEGAFASVYKVRNKQLGYIRAIRVLKETIADEQDEKYQKFLKECQLLLRLGNGGHPNIVRIAQPRLLQNHALVEMEYVQGKDVNDYLIENNHFLSIEEVLRFVQNVSSALAYCHVDIYKFCMDRELDHLQEDPDDGSKVLLDDKTMQRLIEKYKVIHNDIHSRNIIRKYDGSYILLDFGLAIQDGTVVKSSKRKGGAPEYKAPEKWEDEGIISEQSDIYSLGVLMYEMLAGQTPFPYNSRISATRAEYELMEQHEKAIPSAIEPLRRAVFETTNPGKIYTKDYPGWLETVIMKCLEKKPENRYANGKELLEDVKREMAKECRGEPMCSPDTDKVIETTVLVANVPESDRDEGKTVVDVLIPEPKSGERNLKPIWYIGGVVLILLIFLLYPKGIIVVPVEEIPANFTEDYIGLDMIFVAGGTFTMGCTSEHGSDCHDNEKPAHQVTVSDFYIGKYEITQAQWKAVMGDNPSGFKGDSLPVERVNWNDVQAFISKLNAQTDKDYRLPTEAEWEYAARGGVQSCGYRYSGSNTVGDVSWYDNNSGKTHPVGTKRANELGIYDMSGNVWEWCNDWYGTYSSSSQTNPNGALSDSTRVYRGGGWAYSEWSMRVSYRRSSTPVLRVKSLGFRLACSPK